MRCLILKSNQTATSSGASCAPATSKAATSKSYRHGTIGSECLSKECRERSAHGSAEATIGSEFSGFLFLLAGLVADGGNDDLMGGVHARQVMGGESDLILFEIRVPARLRNVLMGSAVCIATSTSLDSQ